MDDKSDKSKRRINKMQLTKGFVLLNSVMLLTLVSQNGLANSEGEAGVTQKADRSITMSVKNTVDSRLNRMTQQLALSPEQKGAIKLIFEDEAIRMRAIRIDNNQNNDERKAKFHELREVTFKKLYPILTPEQQLRLEVLRKDLIERRQNKIVK